MSGGAGARTAAALSASVLVAISVLAPWAYGAVQPTATRAVVAAGLLAAVAALAIGALCGGLRLPAVPLWPLAAVVGLALLQLLPLPGPAHHLLAPGSWAVWRPADATAAIVLGDGARPVSLDPQTTLRGAALVAALGLLAALAAPAMAAARVARVALGAVAASGFGLSVYAIFARVRFGALLYGSLCVATTGPFGPFVNKNHFAGWCAMAALLTVGLALGLAEEARRGGRDWTTGRRAGAIALALVAALAMALAVLASLSRGGTLALATGAACLLALVLVRARRQRSRALAAPLSLAAVLAVIVVSMAPPVAHERLRSLSGAEFRLDTWRDALRLAASSPLLGHGLGAFHDAYPPFKQGHGSVRVEHAESEYLEILAEMGVPGLLASASGLVLLFLGAARAPASGDAPRPLIRGLGRGALAALAALAAHGLLDFDLRIPSNAALAALAAATAAAAAGLRPRALDRRAAAVLALGLLVLLAAVLSRADEPWLRAREEVRRAARAAPGSARALRLERAEAALRAVLQQRPGQAESWLMLAGVRQARGDGAAAGPLVRHAVRLDPGRPELREAARRLIGDTEGR